MSKVAGKLTDGIDAFQDQIDRQVPEKDPVQFMKDWIQDELPSRVEDLALLTMGDYSAMPTKRVLDAADDPEFGGDLFKPVREGLSRILPGG